MIPFLDPKEKASNNGNTWGRREGEKGEKGATRNVGLFF